MTGQQIFETALALFDEPTRGKFAKSEYAELNQADEQPSLVPKEWHHILANFMVKEFFKIDKGDRSQGYIKWDSIYEQVLAKMKHYLNKILEKMFGTTCCARK